MTSSTLRHISCACLRLSALQGLHMESLIYATGGTSEAYADVFGAEVHGVHAQWHRGTEHITRTQRGKRKPEDGLVQVQMVGERDAPPAGGDPLLRLVQRDGTFWAPAFDRVSSPPTSTLQESVLHGIFHCCPLSKALGRILKVSVCAPRAFVQSHAKWRVEPCGPGDSWCFVNAMEIRAHKRLLPSLA